MSINAKLVLDLAFGKWSVVRWVGVQWSVVLRKPGSETEVEEDGDKKQKREKKYFYI